MENPYNVMTTRIVGRAVQRLREKSRDYGDTYEELGLAGQYSDMHRKMRKLRKAMWHEEPLTGEQPEEILEDLLGNILISLYLYEQESNPTYQRSASSQPRSGQDTEPQRAIAAPPKGQARQQAADEVRKPASS
ncbi:MAG TPA: hypothetical protein VH593_11965 [Ktedonobacteraceae bacterium]